MSAGEVVARWGAHRCGHGGLVVLTAVGHAHALAAQGGRAVDAVRARRRARQACQKEERGSGGLEAAQRKGDGRGRRGVCGAGSGGGGAGVSGRVAGDEARARACRRLTLEALHEGQLLGGRHRRRTARTARGVLRGHLRGEARGGCASAEEIGSGARRGERGRGARGETST